MKAEIMLKLIQCLIFVQVNRCSCNKWALILLCLGAMTACKNDIEQKREQIEIFPSGAVKSKTIYSGGRKDGREEIYFENGKIAVVNHFKDDTLSGWRIEYSEDGWMEGKAFYEEGKRNGPFFGYYPNGNILTSGVCRNDLIYGKVFNYFEVDSGKVESEEWLMNAEGKEFQYYIKYFDSEGNVVSEERDICFDGIVSEGSSHSISLRYCGPEEFDSLKLVSGKFSYDFRPLGQIDTFRILNNRINLRVQKEILLDSFVRGKVLGYKTSTESDQTRRRTTFIFFEEKLPN